VGKEEEADRAGEKGRSFIPRNDSAYPGERKAIPRFSESFFKTRKRQMGRHVGEVGGGEEEKVVAAGNFQWGQKGKTLAMVARGGFLKGAKKAHPDPDSVRGECAIWGGGGRKEVGEKKNSGGCTLESPGSLGSKGKGAGGEIGESWTASKLRGDTGLGRTKMRE